jgi:hypothetical protein
MPTIIAQAQRLSGFFNKLAHRLYDARLVKAERELKRVRTSRPRCDRVAPFLVRMNRGPPNSDSSP